MPADHRDPITGRMLPTHGARALEQQRRLGRLDAEAQAEVDALVAHYAEDAGGVSNLTNRELSILRDVAFADLVIACMIQHAHSRGGDIVDAAGNLLPALGKSFLAYINSKRLGLVAVGLRPDRTRDGASLEDYIARRSAPPPAPVTSRPVRAEDADDD